MLRFLYPDGIVVIAGRPPNKELVKTASALTQNYSKLKVKAMVGKDCGWGDEGSFWDEGYDAIYVNSYYKNPYHHTREDRLDFIDFDFLTEATKAALATLMFISGPST